MKIHLTFKYSHCSKKYSTIFKNHLSFLLFMPKKSEKQTKKESQKTEEIVVEKEKLPPSEYEKKVFELSKKGFTSEKIGEALRKEGIHPKDYDKKISKILKENNSYINPDLKNIEDKLSRIQTHFDKNKQDKKSMREKDRVFAQLRKLKKYHKAA